ncbi:hypothetical protein DFQ26_005207 [Actinomortierella ambigua]|nr:hypothetical protein DFQ26_005207 [Actinomortierella ambigua]
MLLQPAVMTDLQAFSKKHIVQVNIPFNTLQRVSSDQNAIHVNVAQPSEAVPVRPKLVELELELKKRECEKKTHVAMDSLPVTLPPDLYCFDRAEDRKATEAAD